jgi:uncharacterized protein (TIGR03083 family)
MFMNRRRWSLVESQRVAVADQIAALRPEEWDQPSRCRDWRVRDVLGHLVHLSETPLRVRARQGDDPDPARQLGERPVPELCGRLRAAAASTNTGMPLVALSEVVAHGDDMLRPLGHPMKVPPQVAVAVLKQLRRVDRLAARWAFGGQSHRGVQFAATDVRWVSGKGPQVRGTALDLIALLTNRAGVIGQLTGPGVAQLPEYRRNVPGSDTT